MPTLLRSRSPSACSRWRCNSKSRVAGAILSRTKGATTEISSSNKPAVRSAVPRLFSAARKSCWRCCKRCSRTANCPASSARRAAKRLCSVSATIGERAFNSAGTENSDPLISERSRSSLMSRPARRCASLLNSLLASTGSISNKTSPSATTVFSDT